MAIHKCPICEIENDISDQTRIGARITCPGCFAQLALYKYKGKRVLACAICKEPVFDPANCDDCERRREKKSLLEEGKL